MSERKVCVECGLGYWNWGAHAEECVGPRQRIADPPVREPDCGCGPGMFHRHDCPLVTGQPKDAA